MYSLKKPAKQKHRKPYREYQCDIGQIPSKG